MDVRTRARRILSKGEHLVGYRHLEDELGVADRPASLPSMDVGEELLGVYENPPESGAPTIFVTTKALRLLNHGQARTIFYCRIKRVVGPADKGPLRPSITLHLDDGALEDVAVLGGKGRFLDVFEFLRFLMRVVEDQQPSRPA